MLTSYLTSMALIDDRRCGIWHRSLMAGATPFQFFIAHLITGGGLMTLQALEFIAYALYIGNNSYRWEFAVPTAGLIFFLGLAGCLYGLCISVLTDSTLAATYFSILATYPFLALSGELQKQSYAFFNVVKYFISFQESFGLFKVFHVFLSISDTCYLLLYLQEPC